MSEPQSYKTEFPDYVLDLAIPPAWEDSSWKNDACPSWIHKHLQVYVDYTNPADRECEFSSRFLKRFAVMPLDEEDQATHHSSLLDTDEWDEVLRFVENYNLEIYYCPDCCTIVINCDNQNKATLCQDPPAPQLGEIDHYDSFLNQISRFYSDRFSHF